MVAALRGARVIGSGLRAEFGYPSDEPMLWVADAVAGAVGMARKGVDVDLVELMGGAVRQISIEI